MLVSLLSLALVVPMAAPADAPASTRPLPVSAHNCYAEDRATNERLAEALALGIDNIEIDLGWDEAGRRLIVAHVAAPQSGVAYPELEAMLVPALEAHWRTPRADSAPTILTIDWKTEHPDAVVRFKEFLDAHPDWFTSAPKAAESLLTPRRLTVCFSGSDRAKDLYDALIPPGGVYRAFRDVVWGAGVPYRANITEYAPARASAYHRFLAFHWGHVERGGPARGADWTQDEAARLDAILALAHSQGFRVRFYTLNGHFGPFPGSYRFVNDSAAHLRWHAAARAGADWIATDEYADIVRELGKPPAPTPSP